MNLPITQEETALLLRVITAVLIAEAIYINCGWLTKILKNKWKSGWLYLHAVLAGLLVYLFSTNWFIIWLPLVFVFTYVVINILHALIGDNVKNLLFRGVLLLLVTLICWFLLIGWNQYSLYTTMINSISQYNYWAILASFIFIIWPAGVLIQKSMAYWQNQLTALEESTGLEKAGLWIGRLERSLVLVFVLMQRYEAIGFLIAAKSIYRFGELHSPNARKYAEYYLVGTFMSFSIAILCGLLSIWIIRNI